MTARWFIILLLGAAAGIVLFGYSEATSDPLIRRAKVAIPDWPASQAPVRLVLLSDIHVAGPDMPPRRLSRIVDRINGLKPDLVLISGDFISDRQLSTRRYSEREMAAPLRRLRPRLGTIAVLGNHDHWRNGVVIRSALEWAGIRVLNNDAVRTGPLVVGGIDDVHAGHPKLATTVRHMRSLGGSGILLSHSPDAFPDMPRDVRLMLAGHTHCGQIVLPAIGPLVTASAHGRRYRCGIIIEHGKAVIVTAGLGTSIVPIRIGAPPDMWLIELDGGRGTPVPDAG